MARATAYGDQKEAVVQAIADRRLHHSRQPTVRELAEQFEVSVATMHSWLGKLKDEGLVEWTPGRHRSLRTTP
jgi:DNA-binding transcriptional regulator YhcF (GntR family)